MALALTGIHERTVIRGYQRQSEAIEGNGRQSEAIKGNQRQSETIRGNERQSEAISGNQRRSEVIIGDQRQSEVSVTVCACHYVIRGNQMSLSLCVHAIMVSEGSATLRRAL